MDSKSKHPFAIKCRYCGSDHCIVCAYDNNCLSIECCDCGKSLNCGVYDTYRDDYSGMH